MLQLRVDSDDDVRDGLAQVDGVAVASGDGLLGEVEVFVGEGIVDLGHGVDRAAVEMEAGAVDVFVGLGISQDGERVERVVEVVVVENDLGFDAGFFEGRAEIVFDEVVLFGFEHQHAGGVLFVQRLVLNGERVDGDAFGLHGLDVFDEVGGVGGEVFGLEHAAAGDAAGFHPERSGPGGGEDFDLRVDGEDFFHHGDDVGRGRGRGSNFAMAVSVSPSGRSS